MSPLSPHTNHDSMIDQRSLRRQLKQARTALPDSERAAIQIDALERLARLPAFRRAQTVAGYFGSKGELDPMPLLRHAARAGKDIYLPVLHPFREGMLWFCHWHPGEPLQTNRFDIPEPILRKNRLRAARQLDLVIVPLLGFDDRCHRLGMGGGYYDRTFAFVRRFTRVRRPLLLGLAGEHQRVDALQPQAWDVTLDGVVTERMLHRH